ncbi:Uncharacterised protein [Orientia tsutsugamushi]|uniref:Uncharacterized protein n=2 Tax=Orientia tsutsugamushi TaxID=784 RepID=A0A2U3RPJ1_ORITS|nr:Uncharacterised protein [Orientia tsutsugamushi]SPR16180.1 Uncharacterised protein [Orientia tsutsugamushi]SPR16429.1 Uncharacterised protein [Orientia tsutsugamushi]
MHVIIQNIEIKQGIIMNPFSIAAAKALSFATESMSDAVECVNKIMLNSVSANCNVTTFRKIPPADELFASTDSILACNSSKIDPYRYLGNTMDSIRMFGITYNPDLLHECTGQEVLTSSNAISCEKNELLYEHNVPNYDDSIQNTVVRYCISSCKIINCNLIKLKEFCSGMGCDNYDNTTYSSVNFVNVTTSPEEENFFTSATATVAGVIVPWIVPTVLAVSGGIALYGIYHLRSSKNKTSSLPVNSVDVGTNANTSVKNLNAEKISTDFLDNDAQAHLYEDLKTYKCEEAAYDDTALPISGGQDAIRAEAV